MINIPNEKKWIQGNNSDLFGNIHVTKNINFNEEGYLKLSGATKAIMNSGIDADFDVPAVIILNEDYGYFVQTWDSAFSANEKVLSAYPTKITDASVPVGTSSADATWFGGLMPVTESTDLHYYDVAANTWTDTNISLTSSGQHPLTNFLSYPALAVANVNTVNLYKSPLTSTPTLLTTCTLLSDYEITSIIYLKQNIFIATRNKYGGKASLFVWNGSGTVAQSQFETDSNIIYSLAVFKDSIVCLNGQGQLLSFNGSGFVVLDSFPIFYTDRALSDTTNLGMYHNIIKSNGDVIYILFNDNYNVTHRLLNQPEGIWCYDERVGLYNKYSLTKSLIDIKTINTTSVDISTNQITVPSPAYATGTEVYYVEATTPIGGLTTETKYFVIKIDDTHIKLATTKSNAIAGTNIDLTSTGAVTQKLRFIPNIDYGDFFNKRTMSIGLIDRPTALSQHGTDLIFGSEVFQRTLTGDDAVIGSVMSTVESRGYFITPKIFSEGVTDKFNLLTIKFSKMKTELDKIIIKYRTSDDRLDTIDVSSATNWNITWTSINTFTTTQTEWSGAMIGNEVNVLSGAAGGLLAHITNISIDSGTYTVTIDEEFTNYITGDKSVAVFKNWIKYDSIDWLNTDCWYSKDLGAEGKFLQLKIELRGIDTRIEEIKVDNKYSLPAKS